MRHVGMLLGAVACLLAGCGSSTQAPDYASADRFTLYSIDGNVAPSAENAPDDAPHFHGYPILGKVDLDSASDRRALVDALYDGIAASDGTAAACFIPRHAIRVVEGDHVTDYVICFECLAIEIYAGGQQTNEQTTAAPRPVFNRYLEQAAIPLAP